MPLMRSSVCQSSRKLKTSKLGLKKRSHGYLDKRQLGDRDKRYKILQQSDRLDNFSYGNQTAAVIDIRRIGNW
ncbi:MAG: hypothetical protein ACK556_24000, partial [Pseudanabaena sp.]